MNENNFATTAVTQSSLLEELFEHGHSGKLKYALLWHLNFHCSII